MSVSVAEKLTKIGRSDDGGGDWRVFDLSTLTPRNHELEILRYPRCNRGDLRKIIASGRLH